jgi:hypothetical protein
VFVFGVCVHVTAVLLLSDGFAQLCNGCLGCPCHGCLSSVACRLATVKPPITQLYI